LSLIVDLLRTGFLSMLTLIYEGFLIKILLTTPFPLLIKEGDFIHRLKAMANEFESLITLI